MAEKKKKPTFAELKKKRNAVNDKTLADKKKKGPSGLGRTGKEKAANKKNQTKAAIKEAKKGDGSILRQHTPGYAPGEKKPVQKREKLKSVNKITPKQGPKQGPASKIKTETIKQKRDPARSIKGPKASGLKKAKVTATTKGPKAPATKADKKVLAKKIKKAQRAVKKTERTDKKSARKAAGGSKFGKALKKIGKTAAKVGKGLARVGAGATGHYTPNYSLTKKDK